MSALRAISILVQISKADIQESIDWKLTDESWAKSRAENPEWIAAHSGRNGKRGGQAEEIKLLQRKALSSHTLVELILGWHITIPIAIILHCS